MQYQSVNKVVENVFMCLKFINCNLQPTIEMQFYFSDDNDNLNIWSKYDLSKVIWSKILSNGKETLSQNPFNDVLTTFKRRFNNVLTTFKRRFNDVSTTF